MVDSEYRMDIYKSAKINIGTVVRKPEMLKFIPDHLKTKNMYKHAVKNLPYQLKSDSQVPENFCQLKLSPVVFKKIPSFLCLVFKNENKLILKFVNFVFLKNRLI